MCLSKEKKYFADTLQCYQLGTEFAGDTDLYNKLRELLPKYYKESVIKCFRIAQNGSRHFEFLTYDEWVKLSYTEGLNKKYNKNVKHSQKVIHAFRRSVKDILKRKKYSYFKKYGTNKSKDNQYGTVVCGMTGKQINIRQTHVDHVAPMTFQVIVKTFMAAHGLQWKDVKIKGSKNSLSSCCEFEDLELRKKFVQYHNKVSILDLCLGSENIKKSKKNLLKKSRL